MKLAERQQQFLEAVQDHFGTSKAAVRPSKLFRVSNSAKVVSGLQLGVVNLDGAREDARRSSLPV